jgi:hypothetical protein
VCALDCENVFWLDTLFVFSKVATSFRAMLQC